MYMAEIVRVSLIDPLPFLQIEMESIDGRSRKRESTETFADVNDVLVQVC
jgi:hypothetical protein